MQLPFTKAHGTGNDFVVLPDAAGELELTAELARAICHRRTGLGADGVLRVARVPGEPGAWLMDHYNADGTTPEMCGNGIRVFGRYLVDHELAEPGPIRVLTHGGWRGIDVPATGDVSVDMGPPAVGGAHTVTPAGGRGLAGLAVDMGNPHVVAVADRPLLALDLTAAPTVNPVFLHGVNVELVTLTGDRSLSMRVHERGVGETLSCGTGACAAAVAAATWAGVTGSWRWRVDVPGGELAVSWDGGTLRLIGPAVLVADGVLETDRLANP